MPDPDVEVAKYAQFKPTDLLICGIFHVTLVRNVKGAGCVRLLQVDSFMLAHT